MKKLWRRLFPKRKKVAVVGGGYTGVGVAVAAAAAAAKERRPKEKKLVRRRSTALGGPNMPKYQPCPDCGKWAKRVSKTMNGANYQHGNHQSFFVRAA